ncbi:MAG: chromosomal replication initiator protein DnaA [Anaerolineaceae bacterium]|nr:chromosomal replication initiator protein DnaA [Anaerolineaceae bacterium]
MEAVQAWQATLGQLQMQMPKSSYDTWVKKTSVINYEEKHFTIGVQNAYARDWLESRLSSTVQQLLSGIMNEPQEVQFIVHLPNLEEAKPKDATTDELYVSDSDEEFRNVQPSDDQMPVKEAHRVNGRYTFDNFVVGPSNRLAHAACLAVAEAPARAYNPLFLYGGVGLGKTHMLHAIGRKVQLMGQKVLYVSSEEFTNDYINSVRTHTPMVFRERYRTIDVLMIDDIQFLMGKEQTQEEFFHTFNTLYHLEKQIIISSDRSPKSLATLEERLRSRFEWGLIVDIQPPDLETRIAILRSKAERAGRKIDDDILELIARKIQSNIRELEGGLNRIMAYTDLMGQTLSLSLVNSALADLVPQRISVSVENVLQVVSKVFGIEQARLLGRERSRVVALPRQVAMYILREDGNMSLPQIGKAFGGRDHTTVMHACNKISGLIEIDNKLRRQVIEIREILFGTSNLAM